MMCCCPRGATNPIQTLSLSTGQTLNLQVVIDELLAIHNGSEGDMNTPIKTALHEAGLDLERVASPRTRGILEKHGLLQVEDIVADEVLQALRRDPENNSLLSERPGQFLFDGTTFLTGMFGLYISSLALAKFLIALHAPAAIVLIVPFLTPGLALIYSLQKFAPVLLNWTPKHIPSYSRDYARAA